MATWFSKRECALVESAVRTIAEALDLDEDDLMGALRLPYTHPLDQLIRKHPSHDVARCHVLVDKTKNTQCPYARHGPSKFCKRHTKSQDRNPDASVVIRFEADRGLERFRELKRESRYARMQLIVRDDVDYLYDPLTAYVHDFDTVRIIGKMHPSGQIYFTKAYLASLEEEEEEEEEEGGGETDDDDEEEDMVSIVLNM